MKTMVSKDTHLKESTIFNHNGNKIITEDREINIIARLEEPLVVVLGSVLDDEECDVLIQLAKDKLQRSKIGGNREVSDIRTSSRAFLTDISNDILARVEKRVSDIMGIPSEHGEGLHILNYQPGQEYKEHFDYFASTSKASSNNRIATLVIYLNDVEEGGNTFSPKLNFSANPQKGMAVYFEYFYNDPMLNELTLHGGAPVVKGEKWIATQWMRRQKIN